MQSNRRGIALLEVMVALAIISLAGVAAVVAASAELRSAQHAIRILEANALAELTLAQVLDTAQRPNVDFGRFSAPFDDYVFHVVEVRDPAALMLVVVTVRGEGVSRTLRAYSPVR